MTGEGARVTRERLRARAYIDLSANVMAHMHDHDVMRSSLQMTNLYWWETQYRIDDSYLHDTTESLPIAAAIAW